MFITRDDVTSGATPSTIGSRILVVAMLALTVLLGAAHVARADFGIAVSGGATDAAGTRVSQAGAHPDVTTIIDFNRKVDAAGRKVVDGGNVRDTVVDLPPGLIANPTATPACSQAVFDSYIGSAYAMPPCPAETIVGAVLLRAALVDVDDGFTLPLYNLAPPTGVAGRLGFFFLSSPVYIDAKARTDGDYGITATVRNASQSDTYGRVGVKLWGVPADPVHDGQPRFGPSSAPRRPFVTLPTRCTGEPLATNFAARSWLDPDRWVHASFNTDLEGFPLTVDGCESLAFTPTVAIAPSTVQPDTPTGLDVDIHSPQNLDEPGGLASAHLRNVKVTLPDGMTINPGSAGGLEGCSDDQLGIGSTKAVTCPDAAKIGTVTATTPLLQEQLTGGVFIRSQASNDPSSGDMFRMALVLQSKARGVLVKLPGKIRVDPNTGRIVTEFDDNPQLPVSRIQLHLKAGPRAPLATPATCGVKNTDVELTSWAGHDVHRTDAFTVPCNAGLAGFTPSFRAGTVTPTAGAFSPFTLGITKPDGNSALAGLTVTLPTGLLANLKGSVGTQVGTVDAYAGPGSNPFILPGTVFLEGAYGDAPFSLRVVVPAVAGPFDLGTVEVRQKIYVNPDTAQVTVVSDPIPTIVKGVPVRLQRLDVKVDKPGFMINPTSCAAKEITGTLSSVAGQTAQLINRFQVGDCASLGYAPKLAMTMTGKGQTKDGSHPALSARLTPPVGDANSKKVMVTLPLSLALDPGNANGLCEPADAAKNACPATSIVGAAQAQSILPDTLKAPVYFVRGERLDSKGVIRKTLPKLFIPLTANGVTVNVWGNSNVDRDRYRLVTTFDNLPDAPFSTFDLTINGGKHGILAVSSANTCAANQIADAQYSGQNGKTYMSKITMGTPCALGVVKSSRKATALKLTIGGLGAGKVSASGNGVAKASKTLTSATTATLSLKLAKATRRALARGRDVKVKVKVAFTAKGQKKAKTATKTVVLHGAKKR